MFWMTFSIQLFWIWFKKDKRFLWIVVHCYPRVTCCYLSNRNTSRKKMLPQCMLKFRSKNLFARDGWSLLSRWVYRIRSLIPWPSVSFTCNLIWCHWCLRCWTGKWFVIALCDRTWTQRLFALTYHRTSILPVWKKILYPLFSIQSTVDKHDLELGGGETEGALYVQ